VQRKRSTASSSAAASDARRRPLERACREGSYDRLKQRDEDVQHCERAEEAVEARVVDLLDERELHERGET
jgi:hypothetical protein